MRCPRSIAIPMTYRDARETSWCSRRIVIPPRWVIRCITSEACAPSTEHQVHHINWSIWRHNRPIAVQQSTNCKFATVVSPLSFLDEMSSGYWIVLLPATSKHPYVSIVLSQLPSVTLRKRVAAPHVSTQRQAPVAASIYLPIDRTCWHHGHLNLCATLHLRSEP